MKQGKRLTIEITEEELHFIYEQAQERNLSISEYISLCTLAHNNLLYLSKLSDQLRRLKYQLNAINSIDSTESEELITLQKDTYTMLLNILRAVQKNG